MEAKHTPGDWFMERLDCDSSPPEDAAIAVVGELGIFSDGDFGPFDYHQSLANATLLRAAPELLSALQGVLAAYRDSISGAEVDQARKAIAKALGE